MFRIILILALCFSTEAFAKSKKHAKPIKPKGIQVYEVAEGSALQQLGVQKGDIVTKVDGLKPLSIDEMNAKFNELKYSQAMDVVVVRKGKQKTLHYVQD